jgi:transposase
MTQSSAVTSVEGLVCPSRGINRCGLAEECVFESSVGEKEELMTIPKELEAQIIRLYETEKWPIGTIAMQLEIHHSVVERVLNGLCVIEVKKPRRSIADPYLPFIVKTLESYPTLSAARLFVMVRERGYPGISAAHFRRIIARYRPRLKAEAYLRLRTLPGEQGQVDWGHFGHIIIGKAKRALIAFVLVLSFSRHVFLRFFVNQKLASFLQGHVMAFETLGGIPRVILYDNPKTVVLERYGDAIRFHPTLLECAKHYHYEPRPVAVARGNQKGRVERAIRYIRQSFWPAREFYDLDNLNEQAQKWCEQTASARAWPDDRSMTVREVFEQEKEQLLPLPDNPFPVEERVEVKVGKTPYVRFDLNDYSVPHSNVRQTLSLVASPTRVRILDGVNIVAEHPRSYDKGRQIEDPSHIDALTAEKAAARHHRAIDRLRHAVPLTHQLLIEAAERGYKLGRVTATLLVLLDQYGANELSAAVAEALERGVPHPHAVRQSLERRRQEQEQPPPLSASLLNDPKLKDIVVRPHDLAAYDMEEEASDDHDIT